MHLFLGKIYHNAVGHISCEELLEESFSLDQGVALLFIPAISSLLTWFISWAEKVQKNPLNSGKDFSLTQLSC